MHPVGIIDRTLMGSIRDVINYAPEELSELKGISAPAPVNQQIELPGLETQSILPAVLPLPSRSHARG